MANRLHRSADDQEPEEPDAKVKSEPIANEQSSIQHEVKSEQKVEPIEEEEEDFSGFRQNGRGCRPCHLVKGEPDAIPADNVEMNEEEDEDLVAATEPLSVQLLPSHFLRPPITAGQFDGQTEFRLLECRRGQRRLCQEERRSG